LCKEVSASLSDAGELYSYVGARSSFLFLAAYLEKIDFGEREKF
jgi:hypothetical protein